MSGQECDGSSPPETTSVKMNISRPVCVLAAIPPWAFSSGGLQDDGLHAEDVQGNVYEPETTGVAFLSYIWILQEQNSVGRMKIIRCKCSFAARNNKDPVASDPQQFL